MSNVNKYIKYKIYLFTKVPGVHYTVGAGYVFNATIATSWSFHLKNVTSIEIILNDKVNFS